jgi:SAM-dependent methyltransferase
VEQLTECIGCGAPAQGARPVHRRRDDALVLCPRCGLLYANPQYTNPELDRLYAELYYDEHKNFATDFRERDYEATRVLYEAGVDDLLSRYPRLRERPTRVFDFGCGVGFFLVACKKRGLVARGCDFSPEAARYGRERLGLDVAHDDGGLLATLPDASFELVTAWQVLEHLRRPREVLRQLVRVLAPGGVLAVAVPHVGALRYRLEGVRWFNMQNLTHLAFFNRDNLSALLRDEGLVRVIRPLMWGGKPGTSGPANLALYLARVLNLGNELRLYAEKAR